MINCSWDVWEEIRTSDWSSATETGRDGSAQICQSRKSNKKQLWFVIFWFSCVSQLMQRNTFIASVYLPQAEWWLRGHSCTIVRSVSLTKKRQLVLRLQSPQRDMEGGGQRVQPLLLPSVLISVELLLLPARSFRHHITELA